MPKYPDVDNLTDEELRQELVKILAEQVKKRSYHQTKESRWDRIQRDPKAYFTRRRDWLEAQKNEERFGWDLKTIPKLNEGIVESANKNLREETEEQEE